MVGHDGSLATAARGDEREDGGGSQTAAVESGSGNSGPAAAAAAPVSTVDGDPLVIPIQDPENGDKDSEMGD